MNTVDISIVIGTYNRADVLRQALASLAALETDGRFTYEIVVVDNASTDDTSAVVAEANASNADAGHAVAVRGFVEPRKGVAAARNHAIRESRGRWIAFHDDDQMAEPRWLAELLSLANEKSCPVVGGDVRLVLPESNERQLSRVCRRLLGEMIDMPEVCRFSRRVVPGTNNLMIERTVFDTVGLFDEQMLTGGEDAELYRRIRTCGFECWYTPRAVVHHIIPEFRLADDYMRWTSMRQGEHVALREQQDWGRGAMPLVVAARTAQALVNYLPRYVAARLIGDRERALGARCLLWRSEGYLRGAAANLLPSVFGSDSFRAAMNFREGRQKLAGTNSN
jgi:glycosyltransferase involved in cell wall biosynthesis